jgi:PAS domain S-box-containing protein
MALNEHKKNVELSLDLLGVVPQPICHMDQDGVCDYFNKQWLDFRGATFEQAIADGWASGIHSDDERQFLCAMELAFQENESLTASIRSRRFDGEYQWMSVWFRPYATPDGESAGYLMGMQDVTDHKEAVDALQASRDRLNSILENAFDYIMTINRDSEYEYINRTEAGVDREDVIGASILDFTPPEQREALETGIKQVWETGKPYEHEVSWRNPSGELTWYWSRIGPIIKDGEITALAVSATDITDRKREEERRRKLDAQVQHAQKLESLGVLAGGIAHDFNNILVAILGYSDLALRVMPSHDPNRQYLEEIGKGARSAADLATQMLAYSGKGTFELKEFELNGLVTDMAHLLEVTLSKKVKIKYDLATDHTAVKGDPSQVRQVIMNLITNASDAIGDEPGAISVSTGTVEVSSALLQQNDSDEQISEGTYVFLDVEDSGCGMDQATLDRLFDPFFTTKFAGRGLGMAAVQGIMSGHKGMIKVISDPGVGSTFKVLFPANDLPSNERRSSPRAAEDNRWIPAGSALIVDDDDIVRDLGKRMLEEIGFDVRDAQGGLEAIGLLQELQDDIKCVILDLTMPEMDGVECFEKLRQIKSGIPIIIMSGYSKEEIAERFATQNNVAFVQKPYTLDLLTAKLREILA